MQRLFKAICLLIITAATSPLLAQQTTDTAYLRTVHTRAAKIVDPLELTDASKAARATDVIANQYVQLNIIQEYRETSIKAAKAKYGEDKAALDKELVSIEESVNTRLQKLHGEYIAQLSPLLTPAQIDKVKDGMTYGVVPITYNGYINMIPALTEPQKAQIMTWLIEAREHAMDAFTSDKKHAWFGKYKGRINNYLSAQGYDSKKEREEWMKRLKAAEEAKGKS
jgi:hypothetical protein